MIKIMLETEFKTLMQGGKYVNADLLWKGIYICSKPFLYSKDETIEKMIERAEQVKDMVETNFNSDKFIENLQKCELVKIFVTFS